MNKDKDVFDKEFVARPIIFLKDVGRYCEVCKKHIFGRSDKKVCSRKCNDKKAWDKKRNNQRITSLHASISLEVKTNRKVNYRVMNIYLKKGVVHQIKVTEESKELWNLLDKIENFRNMKKPLEVMN